MNFLSALPRAALAAMLFLAAPALAHEGHDHADTKSAALQTTTPRLEAVGGTFELVTLLRQGELLIYLDDSRTNEPITEAAIAVETPKGPATAEAFEGIYRLSAPWADTGTHNLIFTVTHKDSTEILSGALIVSPAAIQSSRLSSWLADLQSASWLLLVAGIAFAVGALWRRAPRRQITPLALAFMAFLLASGSAGAHEGHDHEPGKNIVGAGGDLAQRLADGTLFVPKPTQRILAIRTMVTEISAHSKTLELPGRIIPDPNASGFVQASVSGRLSAPEGGFPKLGAVVKAGDVLAFVTPPFQAIDVSEIRQKAGELDGQIDIVARRVARYETLAKSGVVNKVALDDALAELKSLRERRFQLDKTRQESERLIAPVSGVIAASNAIAGQIAETNSVVFHIVDPAKLWVEALTFTLLPDGQPATALTGEGRKLKLSFQGAGLTDRSQAIPVHFAIEGKEQGLRVGQLVTVLAVTGDQLQGLAVPRTSVLRAANGQHIVFEHTAAERFEPRMVRVEPLDAERVLLLDGFAPSKRIVVQGAELLNQIR
jgi:hypothetical protein